MTAHPQSFSPADSLDAPLNPLSEAALEWLVRLHDGTATEAEWAAYDAWQAETPERMVAARRAEQVWESLGPALKRPKGNTARPLALLLAGACLLISGWFAASDIPAALLADQRTGTGESRRLALADGSLLLLDAATSVDIDVTPEHRRLTLHRGAVHVQVAVDTTRPFEVIAAGGRARALGTAFDVRHLPDGDVRIAVTEHTVRVTYPSDGMSRDVTEGQTLRYGPRTGLEVARNADLRGITAWQRSRLVFDRMPLGAVVGEMERYRGGYIFIADPALRDMPVTGVFDTGDSQGLLDAIVATLPVQIRQLPFAAIITPQSENGKKIAR
jgi:transmembrane sensor